MGLASIFKDNKDELNISIDGPKKYGWMNSTSKSGRGSIVSMAAKNTFEFPVFMSSSVPLEYATAANTLLEQIYVSFLQTTISSQPYVDEKSVMTGHTFEKFKSDTNKFVEYATTQYQKDAYHNELTGVDGSQYSFDLVSVEDSTARMINEACDYIPLSEFDDFFQEDVEYDVNDRLTVNVGAIGVAKGVEDVILQAKKLATYKDDRARDIQATLADTNKKIAEAEKLRRDLQHYDKTESDKAKKTELEVKKLETEISDLTDKLNRDISKYRKDMMAKAPEVLDESKMSKLNTMKPYMMKVQIIVRHDDGKETPMEQIIGVKCRCRLIDASTLPDVASFPLKEMNKAARKARWKAGELKFLKDFVFETKEKKQTAIDKLDASRSWYKRLYELAHRKGDTFAARVTSSDTGGAISLAMKTDSYGIIPNATIVVTQNDVDNVKAATGIDLMNGSVAAKLCDELFLIAFMVIDEDAQSLKLLLPDLSKSFEVHSMGSLNKQMAELDTAGAKTRQVFNLLK